MPGNSSCLQNYKVTEMVPTLTFTTHQPFSFPKIEPLQSRIYINLGEKKNQDIYMEEKSQKKNESFAIKSSHKMVMWCMFPRGKDPPEKKSKLHKMFFKKLRAIFCLLYLVELTSNVFS